MFKVNYTEGKKMKNSDVQNGLKLLAIVGITGAIYGFKLGRDSGYKRGVSDGYTTASNEFIDVMKDLTAELKVMNKE